MWKLCRQIAGNAAYYIRYLHNVTAAVLTVTLSTVGLYLTSCSSSSNIIMIMMMMMTMIIIITILIIIIMSEIIRQTFRHFTYVTTHSPNLPSIYLRHSSFSNHSVASPTSQFILQPFFRFFYVTSYSLNSPGEPAMSCSTSTPAHKTFFLFRNGQCSCGQ